MRKLYLTSIKLQLYIKTIRNSYITQKVTHTKSILNRKNTVEIPQHLISNYTTD